MSSCLDCGTPGTDLLCPACTATATHLGYSTQERLDLIVLHAPTPPTSPVRDTLDGCPCPFCKGPF